MPTDLPPLPEGWRAESARERVWAYIPSERDDDMTNMVTFFDDGRVDGEVWDIPLPDLLAVLSHLQARAEQGGPSDG